MKTQARCGCGSIVGQQVQERRHFEFSTEVLKYIHRLVRQRDSNTNHTMQSI